MADPLLPYRTRRNFAVTAEPAGGGRRSRNALSFVVQKHWATRLHYDFRLELDGVMKSWAVPKGPSYVLADKRMAVQVEDHPIAYNRFEGDIPSGQYGAGKVVIWDKGSWQPIGDARAGLRAGKLAFELRGHKLRGRWALVRMRSRDDDKQPAWLLIKEKDGLEQTADRTSVVDALPDSVADLPPPAARGAKAAIGSAATVHGAGAAGPAAPATTSPPVPPQARRAALPEVLAPALATLVEAAPADSAGWHYEIKFDGYRLLARVDGRSVRLVTRNGNDWTHRLGRLHAALQAMQLPRGWYDGEIVVLGERGVPDFGALQRAFDAARPAAVQYFLFDLPFLGAYDLRAVPLDTRRALLQQVLLRSPARDEVRFSDVFAGSSGDVLASACHIGLEGVIGKRRDSPYSSRRTADWIKLKCGQRQEFVIGGYTDPQGSRLGFGALLLGVHDAQGRLQHAGNVGTGFDQRTLADLQRRLRALAVERSPFADAVSIAGRPHWVKPQLVAEVSFGEWTQGGRIRHSVFRGLRTDKPATAIVREQAAATVTAPRRNTVRQPRAAPTEAATASVRVTHPARVVDAASGLTKLELVRYYERVGPVMLEHLHQRPVALQRAPDGVGGELFFQKHANKLSVAGLHRLDPTLDPGHDALLEIVAAEGLAGAAQFNVIEFHTWNARHTRIEQPDRMTFDLDPGEGVAWPQMQEAARLVRVLLTELRLPSFLKTSGGKGLHVVVPLKPAHGWDAVKGFSQAIVQHLAATLPQLFVAKSGPRNREGRIFADYLRNGRGATTVCAWSARARPGLGVSVPVAWDELDGLQSSDQWTVASVDERLRVGNSPWRDYAKSAATLGAAMQALGYQAG